MFLILNFFKVLNCVGEIQYTLQGVYCVRVCVRVPSSQSLKRNLPWGKWRLCRSHFYDAIHAYSAPAASVVPQQRDWPWHLAGRFPHNRVWLLNELILISCWTGWLRVNLHTLFGVIGCVSNFAALAFTTVSYFAFAQYGIRCQLNTETALLAPTGSLYSF